MAYVGKKKGTSAGFGFVNFESQEEQKRALHSKLQLGQFSFNIQSALKSSEVPFINKTEKRKKATQEEQNKEISFLSADSILIDPKRNEGPVETKLAPQSKL